MEKQLSEKLPRVEVVDALRGFAVMAILLVHSLEHFIFPVYPVDQPAWLNILNDGVFNVTFTLLAGKSYAIFALLFGFTFYIQSANQQRKGKDFGYRFLWRLLLLVAFATLNAAFFPAGDVLLLFSVVGIVLFVVRKWSDCAILVTAILFLLQPVEWYHYIVGLFDPSHTLPDWGVGAMYKEVAEYTKEGNLWEFLGKNMTFGQKASLYWALGAGRFWQTAGLFLMGLYIGRKQLFVTSEKHTRFWVKALIISAISFAPLFQLKELIMASDSELIRQTAGTAFDMWQKFAFTFVLVASFVLLYQRDRFKNFVSNLRYYGRMSLTNYITQSIAGAIIYFPFGLYLAPYCGYTLSLLVGFVLFLLQVQFCKWWLKGHKHLPEMMKISGLDYKPVFNPLICDYFSGMVVTVPVLTRLLPKKYTLADIHKAFTEHYADANLVKVLPVMGEGVLENGFLAANTLSGKNNMEIFVCGNDDRIVLCSRLDNLGKGASGAAVQCLNIMMGIDETTGLV